MNFIGEKQCFRIQQVRDPATDVYTWEVYLNDNLIHSKVNNNPLRFENVEAWAGDLFYDGANATIYDLQFKEPMCEGSQVRIAEDWTCEKDFGTCVKLFKNELSWTDATNYCAGIGATLVSIPTVGYLDWVRKILIHKDSSK